MTTTHPAAPTPTDADYDTTPEAITLHHAVRDYVRTYARWHGRPQAALHFGVSRHTLWRCLERGHLGRALPKAVTQAAGDDPHAIAAATWAMTAVRPITRQAAARPRPLPEPLEDALRLLCAAPLTTVEELSAFGRIPETTLRRRLGKLAGQGLTDSVTHHMGSLGPNPRRRYFPTQEGIAAGGNVEHGVERFLSEYPVSREWFRLLTDRLDAVAALYRVAAMVARADPEQQPLRVDHHRQEPYDLLVTLSNGRSLGIVRQRPMLTSANLRYRLKTLEKLPVRQLPLATLVLTHSDQATRRTFRALANPDEHRSAFVATEAELLAGDHTGVAWQQCGGGVNHHAPQAVNPDLSLEGIMAWLGRQAQAVAERRRKLGLEPTEQRPTPDPEDLYPSRLRALMPRPAEQIAGSLALRLTRAEKRALDPLAAWPHCDTDQLAGLMGGVTRRRANQVLRSLAHRGLARAHGPLHLLTDHGLTWLARRDRAAVGQDLDRWTPGPIVPNPHAYVGTALRPMASQPHHHAALTTPAAKITAECAQSPVYGLLDLLPTARSAVTYRHHDTNYAVHPDLSFILDLPQGYRYFFMEYERRATTPKRVRLRLENYRRYYRSGYARPDHGREPPLVLFVFETEDDEEAFQDASGYVEHAPFASSNLDTIARRGILADTWLPPAPEPWERLQLRRLVKVQLFR